MAAERGRINTSGHGKTSQVDETKLGSTKLGLARIRSRALLLSCDWPKCEAELHNLSPTLTLGSKEPRGEWLLCRACSSGLTAP